MISITTVSKAFFILYPAVQNSKIFRLLIWKIQKYRVVFFRQASSSHHQIVFGFESTETAMLSRFLDALASLAFKLSVSQSVSDTFFRSSVYTVSIVSTVSEASTVSTVSTDSTVLTVSTVSTVSTRSTSSTSRMSSMSRFYKFYK